MQWIKASEPIQGNHHDTIVVRFAGRRRMIENRYSEYWVWQSYSEKELRVTDEQWAGLEYLDESTSAPSPDLEAEAEKVYPYPKKENHGVIDFQVLKSVIDNKREGYVEAARRYASTVEALQFKHDSAVECAAQYAARVEALKQENERLREALKGMVDYYIWLIGDPNFLEYRRAVDALKPKEEQ